MGKRFGTVILALVLSLAALGFGDKAPMSGDAVPLAGSALRPLDIVTSSVSGAFTSLHSPRLGGDAGEERYAEVRRAAENVFDIDDMARRALGQHWKDLSPPEQQAFVRLFTDVLTQSFVTIVERHTEGNVASRYEEVTGTFAQVRFRITPEQESEIAIEYRLSESGAQWSVYDVVLDGVSLVSNYRTQFSTIIATSSVSQLLERMRTEQSRRPQLRETARDATTTELEMSARGRLAAGVLLALGSYARWR
ncbi:MAG TPA: ABC transporter substrate-binding protein [Methylomirabilota bacterium]|jgi:phospholipid transport system substrate-binding protein